LKYTERIALKTEKTFIDLNKSLEDITLYKAKQEGLEESVKDLLKSVDEINARFENISTKKDLESIKSDILLIQKQIEEINKVLPIVKTRLPETIENLKREKDDILLFLNSLEDQLKSGVISVGEYEEVKKKNLQRLAEVNRELEKQWKLVEEILTKGAPEIKEEKSLEEVGEQKQELREAVEAQEKEEKIEVESQKTEPPKIQEDNPSIDKKPEETEEKAKREEMVNILKKIKERFK